MCKPADHLLLCLLSTSARSCFPCGSNTYFTQWKSLYNFYVMCFSDFQFPSSPHQNETSTIIRDCWFYLEAAALGTSLSHWWKRAAHYSGQEACKLNAPGLRHINNKDVNPLYHCVNCILHGCRWNSLTHNINVLTLLYFQQAYLLPQVF